MTYYESQVLYRQKIGILFCQILMEDSGGIKIDKNDKFGYGVLEHSGAPIVVLDLTGRIVLFNPASEKLSGYRFADLEGQYFWEMLSVQEEADSMRESEIPALVKEIQRGVVTRTYCWQDIQGKNHYVEWVITPMSNGKGAVKNIILTGLDETEHHRSELAIADSEARYRTIVEMSQEGIWTIDTENHTTFVNAQMAEMLGYSVDEMLGKSVLDFTDEQGRENARKVLERRKRGIKEQHVLWLRHKNGTVVWAQLNASPLLNEQGDYIGAMAMVTDITERKRTEEKLAQTQRMLEQANSVAILGAWQLRMDSGETEYSDVLRQIFEVEPGAPISLETGIDFYKEGQDRDKINKVFKRAVEKGEPWGEELRIVTAKGNEKWVRTIGHADFEGNTCLRLYGSLQDITARKRAEQEFERIFELSLDIIGTGNMQGYFTSINSSVKTLLGYDSEEFCSKPFLEFIHPEDVEKTLAKLMEAQSGERDIYIENRYICKDGSIKWIAWNVLALVDENKFYATGRNFTDHKLAEDALRESELWMKNIFNSLEEAVLVVSPERKLLNVNGAACNIFGYTREEIMSSSTELFHVDHEHYLKFGETINKAFSEDKTANFEFVARRKNGEIFPSEHTVSLLKDPDGKIRGIVSVVRDITERKTAREELERHRANLEEMVAERTFELRNAQQELVRKERLATLGQLTATVSHELRNPLGAMRPSIYMLKKSIDQDADEKLVNAVERIDRNITRCDHIIDELLDFTRITDLHKTGTLIDQWLDSVIEEHLELGDVKIRKNYSLDGLRVPVDTDRLQRAIINVVENAYHALRGSEPGANDIAEARLTIGTRMNGDRIEIAISDNGPGIPEDVLPKIFEPLFSTKNFGVGLGMPTVQQIMVQHGGGVDIGTKVGEGTTVTLWLPARDSS